MARGATSRCGACCCRRRWRRSTGGDGRRIYLVSPPGSPPSRVGLAPGIDLKADDGSVVAPLLRHLGGGRSARGVAAGPGDVPLAAVPGWLADLGRRRAGGGAERGTGAAGGRETFVDGERNHHLTQLAGQLRRQRCSPAAIAAELLAVTARRCHPPLPEEEVRRLAHGMARYPAGPGGGDRAHCTDFGKPRRLAARHGDDLRHAAGRGWLVGHGRRWRHDVTGEGWRYAQEAEAAAEPDEAQHKGLVAWAVKSESRQQIEGNTRSGSERAEYRGRSRAVRPRPILTQRGKWDAQPAHR
jgi:hypothetical protein